MDRRNFITTAAIGLGTLPVAAQTVTLSGPLSTGVVFGTPQQVPIEQRKREYAICKQRGHVAGAQDGIYMNSIPAIYPPSVPWNMCKFCGTSFRTVVTRTDEESNAPE